MDSSKGVEYLQRAQECREKALTVQSQPEKDRWLRMAGEWEELAAHYHPSADGDWIRSRASTIKESEGGADGDN
jgi:hypothetical protein